MNSSNCLQDITTVREKNLVVPGNSKIKIHSNIKIENAKYPQILFEMTGDNPPAVLDSLIVVPPKDNVANISIPDDPLIIIDSECPNVSSYLNSISHEIRSKDERNPFSTVFENYTTICNYPEELASSTSLHEHPFESGSITTKSPQQDDPIYSPNKNITVIRPQEYSTNINEKLPTASHSEIISLSTFQDDATYSDNESINHSSNDIKVCT